MAKWIGDPQGRLEVEKVTEELKLPVWKANYKGKFREFWNECWEKIEDSFLKIKKSNEGKEPAITIKETAFNKAFGVSEDTVLEGNKFTQMTGKDYGGILNGPGTKEVGKTYFDKNTKKLYLCKNTNTDISANINNYIAMDSHSILEKLENLSTFKVQEFFSNPSGVKFTVYQYGNLVLVAAYTHGTEILTYGMQYKCNLPYDCYNSSTAITGNNGTVGHFTLRDNILVISSTDSKNPLKNSFMGQMVTFLR